MTDLLSLPFDQYQRYRLVADLVGQIRGERGPLRILDVGGRTAILRSFLPEDHVELVDLEASDARGLVLGDGSRLPFKDSSFDVVAAFDTLEHVPPDRRTAFIAECARVSRGWVMVAGPYRTPDVDEAEELLRGFMKTKLNLEHRYLEEHRAHGLPVRATYEGQLEQLGASVVSFPHANLERWVALMCMEMYMDHDPGLRSIAARFFRFYNQHLYASDHAEPVYRHVLVAAHAGHALPSVTGLLEAPVAPAGALARIQSLSVELLAFDREKDVWKPEFARLKGELESLEVDLGGHKSRLADSVADLAQHQASLTELQQIHAAALREHGEEKLALQADLAEHDKSLAELRSLMEQEKREHAQERATLAADLAEHARTLADTRAAQDASQLAATELETSLREEIAQQAQVLAELGEHLARTEAGAVKMQGELVDAVGQVGEQNERLGAMRAELRDRVGNLKRAFARRKWGD
ncbi:MAG: hypothetical protein ACI8QZ_000307 [Chlamydiales bacterium]